MSSPNRRKWPWVVLFTAIGLVVLFYVGGGWYFSNLVYAGALKAEPYDPASLAQGTVVTVDSTREPATITLRPGADAADETKFDDAVVGLAIGESLVVAGPVERRSDGRQVRPILDIVGGTPSPGDPYGLTRDVWLNPEQAGLDAEYFDLETLEGKTYPTWLIPGKGTKRWAVLVHGVGASRSEMLRMTRPLHAAGYNTLIITYDGDVGAPEYEDGMVTYGRTEWPAVEAAVQYALDERAQQIVLGGASHGGAVVLGFLDRGTLAAKVDGVILDAPVSSLEAAIDEAGEFQSLPGGFAVPESLEDVAKWLVAFRFGVDYRAVDYIDRAGLIEVPLLTFQGSADQTVPQAVNDRFMGDGGSGEAGQYVVVDGADHVLAWNLDPEAYETAVTAFLDALP